MLPSSQQHPFSMILLSQQGNNCKKADRISQLFLQPDSITTTIDEVSSNAKPLVRQMHKIPKRLKKLIAMISRQEVTEEETSLFDVLWLLLASHTCAYVLENPRR